MKPLPTMSTRPRGTPLRPAQDAGERLDVGPARIVEPRSGSSTQPVARTRSANPPGTIVGSRELLAGRLVPREAAGALAAARVVDEATRRPSGVRATTSCPSTVPGTRSPDLLDVRAAEPAGEHVDELAGAVAGPSTSASAGSPVGV